MNLVSKVARSEVGKSSDFNGGTKGASEMLVMFLVRSVFTLSKYATKLCIHYLCTFLYMLYFNNIFT